jgi:hypothetical protein
MVVLLIEILLWDKESLVQHPLSLLKVKGLRRGFFLSLIPSNFRLAKPQTEPVRTPEKGEPSNVEAEPKASPPVDPNPDLLTALQQELDLERRKVQVLRNQVVQRSTSDK